MTIENWNSEGVISKILPLHKIVNRKKKKQTFKISQILIIGIYFISFIKKIFPEDLRRK